jgi:hypothetical protein
MPTTVINANATTQLKLGAGRINNIIVSDPGATWVMAIKDGPDGAGNLRTFISAAKISAGQPFSDAVSPICFRDGIQIVTSGTTPGEIDVQWD